MKVLLCGDIPAADLAEWRQALMTAMPEAEWLDTTAAAQAANEVAAAVVANPLPGSLSALPALRLIQSLWAGVDRLLADPTLPGEVPLSRMVDPAMNAAMAETALWATLSLHRGFFDYAARQRAAVWQQHAQRRADEVRVLVLGAGQMGSTAAARIAAQGYGVSAWRRQSGPTLHASLSEADIVINLLPLTDATRDLLDARFFDAMPRGASLVNLGRGGHLVEADLLATLDAGHLQHAVLDVFRTEPLAADHAFWRHPRVTVLPHAAAMTDPRSAATVAAANLRAVRDGRPLKHVVSRTQGY